MNPVKRVLRNLIALLLVATPLALVVAFAEASLFPAEWMQAWPQELREERMPVALAFWYVAVAWPLILGGCCHQLVMFLSRSKEEGGARRFVLLTTPLVLVGILLAGGSLSDLFDPLMLLPIVVLLLVYGILARPFDPRDGRTDS